jgi:hypothetical protein
MSPALEPYSDSIRIYARFQAKRRARTLNYPSPASHNHWKYFLPCGFPVGMSPNTFYRYPCHHHDYPCIEPGVPHYYQGAYGFFEVSDTVCRTNVLEVMFKPHDSGWLTAKAGWTLILTVLPTLSLFFLLGFVWVLRQRWKCEES